jgi:hypothetical protein
MVAIAGNTYIQPEQLEQQGITDSITENGVHYGVEVQGKIFDDLSPEGLILEDWVKDFHSLSDEFKVQVIDNF